MLCDLVRRILLWGGKDPAAQTERKNERPPPGTSCTPRSKRCIKSLLLVQLTVVLWLQHWVVARAALVLTDELGSERQTAVDDGVNG